MFIVVYDTFIKDLRLTGTDLLVFAAIYGAVVNMGGYISLRHISASTGVSHSSICRIIASFERKGWLSRSSVGHRRKNRYFLHVVIPTGAKKQPVVKQIKNQYLEQNDTSTSSSLRLPIVNNL